MIDRSGTSKNEQVVCKVNEGLNLPSVVNHSSGTETQPKPNNVDSKIRNEAHLADFKKEAANLHRMIRSARFLYERRLELASTKSPKPFFTYVRRKRDDDLTLMFLGTQCIFLT